MYLIELARTIQEDKERRIQEAGRRRRLVGLLAASKPQQVDSSTAAPAATSAAIGVFEPTSRPTIDPGVAHGRQAVAHGRPRRPAQPCGPSPSTGPGVR